jgi:hypothetical protein
MLEGRALERASSDSEVLNCKTDCDRSLCHLFIPSPDARPWLRKPASMVPRVHIR